MTNNDRRLRITSSGLNVRCGPDASFGIVDVARPGELLKPLACDLASVQPGAKETWLLVETPRQVVGYAAAWYLTWADGGSSAPAPSPSSKWPLWWPAVHQEVGCLVGLHARGDGPNRPQGQDDAIFRTAKIKSVKLLSRAAQGGQANRHINLIRELCPGQPAAVLRPMYNFPAHSPITADQFAADVANDVRAFGGASDILWLVEIHNEPNLWIEGFGGTWRSGAEFADWWRRARDLLRPMMPASTRWGFPGLSPGGVSFARAMSEHQFFAQAERAWREADWIGAHSYWQAGDMMSPDFGQSWRWFEQFGKPLAITEFANTDRATPKREKAQQYVNYYRMLSTLPGLLAAYSFIVSTSSGWPEQQWTREMATIVGAR